ncbi:hypothetical protein ONZ45_g12867 [Pleurotus djamor]|nr:hypothetical protein ONZ45_g12867 [Pleurotus djamor]
MALLLLLTILSEFLVGALAKLAPTRTVEVRPESVSKAGYWQKEYHERCGVDMIEAHGANAALSFKFYGSGIVARLLTCEACSDIEIQIDKETPMTIDLSDNGFKCPTSSPTFVKTDLKEGSHVITIKRLEENKSLKFMKFDQKKNKVATGSDGESFQVPFSSEDAADAASAAAGGVAKSAAVGVAKFAAKQAARISVSYAIMTGLKFAAKVVIDQVAGPSVGDALVDGVSDSASSDGFWGPSDDPGVADVSSDWWDAGATDSGVSAWPDDIADGSGDDGGDILDIMIDILDVASGIFGLFN